MLANPPFDHTVVMQMAEHIEHLLSAADAADAHLTFVVVIPTWPEQPCWQALDRSPHRIAALRLPKSKHAYLDGGQVTSDLLPVRPSCSLHIPLSFTCADT